MEEFGAGEILINSIDRDGTFTGYDLELINSITTSVKIPVIACGGAGNVNDLAKAIYLGHASGVAAGSMFVFHGKKRAVLINFPSRGEIEMCFRDNKILPNLEN
jgi:cyclase